MEWHIFNPVIIPIAEIIIYVQTNTKYVNVYLIVIFV